MKFSILTLIVAIITTSPAHSRSLGYKYKMDDINGYKVSRCYEMQTALWKGVEEEWVDDEKCDKVRPKTTNKWIINKELNTSICYKIDVESGGLNFNQPASSLDCENIKPKTKIVWNLKTIPTSCREIDVETSGKNYIGNHHFERCQKENSPKPITKKVLEVNEKFSDTSCVEKDVKTDGKIFYLSMGTWQCKELMPKTVYEIRDFNGKKTCFQVDEETKGKKFIQRCYDFDPNPKAKELMGLANAQNKPASVFDSFKRSLGKFIEPKTDVKKADGKSAPR